MKFLVDAHFPKRLATWLIKNGDDAVHTSDLPTKNNTSDKEIIDIAEDQEIILGPRLNHNIIDPICYAKNTNPDTPVLINKRR